MIISAARSILDAGIRLKREPGYQYWTAGFLLAGTIEIVSENQVLRLERQTCVILPPHTPYELMVEQRQSQVWMIFGPRPHLQEVLQPPGKNSKTFSVAFQNAEIWTSVETGLRELLKWWDNPSPHLLLAENAMEKVLLLARSVHDQQHQSTPDERIGRVVAVINERFGEELSVDILAEEGGLSASRFAHLFRQRMGVTPMSFLESRRMEQARQLLLTTDLPVQQVGLNIGFPNAQHFSTRFRKLFGQSPSAFRKSPRRRFGELHHQS